MLLVPKLQLGNAIADKAPALQRGEAELRVRDEWEMAFRTRTVSAAGHLRVSVPGEIVSVQTQRRQYARIAVEGYKR